jgi:hypothetical protein
MVALEYTHSKAEFRLKLHGSHPISDQLSLFT